MNKAKLILIGTGGHCKSRIDVIEAEGKYEIKGLLDSKEKIGQQVSNYPIIGTDDDIADLVKEGYSFMVCIGQIKNADIRRNLYHHLTNLNATIATIISPHAIVSKHAAIGQGTMIMHGATLNAGARIGANGILNTACTIEHDAHVGNHCHISTHVVLNGDVIVGDEVFIGSGSVVSNNVKIASSVVIGAGSLVIKDINEKGTFTGNPIKKINNG